MNDWSSNEYTKLKAPPWQEISTPGVKNGLNKKERRRNSTNDNHKSIGKNLKVIGPSRMSRIIGSSILETTSLKV
jgi:hypothetical protein